MVYGGIYDHPGGGFHRYGTDRTWSVPHFEKMLYDNAQLLEVYAEAFAATDGPLDGRTTFHGTVTTQACNDQTCLPPSDLPISVSLSDRADTPGD